MRPYHKSEGSSPVCFDMRASILGPISQPSWKAKTYSFQPARSSVLCELACRLTDQPIRCNAVKTREALVDGHRLINGKAYMVNAGQEIIRFDTIRQHTKGKGLGFFTGMDSGRAIRHYAGQFRNFRNPASIVFLFKFNYKIHCFYYSPLFPADQYWQRNVVETAK